MSKAATSPTARLLQNSRLFSLPRPLPAPPLEGLSSTGLFRASDTATTPYPTLQAITTPRSSLSRGDFGLKRALPAKTTRNTSTPHVRVRAQDTYEHVTEFASAADHTQSREKWLEMGLPIVKERENPNDRHHSQRKTLESVFEDHFDNTDPEALMRVQTQPQERTLRGMSAQTMVPRQRWKYTSPHIGGMAEGEFQMWLEKKITPGLRQKWMWFLKEQETKVRVAQAQRQARDEGRPLTIEELRKLEVQLRPTSEELEQIEKELRDRHIEGDNLSSTLSQLLTDFLDLPPLPREDRSPATTDALRAQVRSILDDKAPPSTHPSAGLSHLRTNAIMENHPLYGPQKHRTPVEARVVRPQWTGTARLEQCARLGVGGFVAADPVSPTNSSSPNEAKRRIQSIPDQMATRLDVDITGGNKLWVHPENAQIDDKGRVLMTVSRADDEAVAVKKGDVKYIFEKKRAGIASSTVGSWNASSVARTAPAAARRPPIQGFDGIETGGQLGENDAANIVQLAWEQQNGTQR